MRSQKHSTQLDTSLFDADHDLDLVAMLNNARSEHEVRHAVQLSRARMRARAGEQNLVMRRLRAARRGSRPRD